MGVKELIELLRAYPENAIITLNGNRIKDKPKLNNVNDIRINYTRFNNTVNISEITEKD